MKSTAVVTVLGKDRTGIIAEVSAALAAGGANINDITQSILEGEMFTMTLMVNLNPKLRSFADLQDDLTQVSQKLGVQINLQKADVFRYMHRI